MAVTADAGRDVAFRMLGPLRVTRGGAAVPLGGRQQRAVLARLLLADGGGLSVEQLADALWGDHVPAGASTTIQTYVFRLRQALEPDRERGAPGQVVITDDSRYRLAIPPDGLDAAVFERHLAAGQRHLAAAAPADAVTEFDQALALWRGEVLADLADHEFVQPVAARLSDKRMAALEGKFSAELALGRHTEVIGELDELVTRFPLNEQLQRLRMIALYRCGRPSDALAAYDRLRRQLVDELGADPSPPIQQLHQQLLTHDPALAWHPTDVDRPAATLAAPPPSDEAALDVVRFGPHRVPKRDHPRRRRWPRTRWLIAAAVVLLVIAAGTITAVIVTNQPKHTLSALRPNSVGVISDDGSLHDAVPVGQSPSGITYGAGSIWVANTGDGTVSRIDPHSHAVTQTIPVHAQPVAIAVTQHDVWVANSGDGSVSRISPDSLTEVDRITVGNFPAAIAAGPSGVWVANSGDNTIQRIDPVTGAPGRPVQVGAGPDGLAVDAHSVWVANGTGRSVTRVHTDTNPVQVDNPPIPVGTGPAAIAITSTGVWVANQLDLTVDRIDPNKERSVHTINVGDGPSAIIAAGSTVWVTDEFDGTVTQIDERTDVPRRTIALGALPAGLALVNKTMWVASRASAAAHRGGTLTVLTPRSPEDLDSLDPNDTFSLSNLFLELEPSVYDGLVAYRPLSGSAGATLVPDLATRIPTPTPDGLTYRFTLRKGIRYSDGSYVKASDFKRSMERALVLPNGWGPLFESVIGAEHCIQQSGKPCDLQGGVEADDTAGTVSFHLRAPDPYFLQELTWTNFAIPQTNSWAKDLPTPPPGTGPYKIVDFVKGKSFTLVRNPYFHQWSFAAQPDGFPDVIKWRPATYPQGVQSVLSSGGDLVELGNDSFDPNTASVLQGLHDQHPTLLHSDALAVTDMEQLNTRVPPFNNVLARRAVNFATDRNQLIGPTGGPELASPTCQLLPPNFPAHHDYCPFGLRDAAGHYAGPNLAEAQKLVTESGTRGQHVTVDVNAHAPRGIRKSEYFIGVLKELGYQVTVRTIGDNDGPGPFKFYHNSANKIQIAYAGPWIPDFFVPNDFYDQLLSCSGYLPNSTDNQNVSEFCDPTIDNVAKRARELDSTNPAAANLLWQQLDQKVTDASPIIFTTTWRAVALVSPRLGNYTRTPIGFLMFDQMWVQ
jgi:YVTN family beta-propeller protein